MSDRTRSNRQGPPSFAPTIGLREMLEATPDLVFSTDAWGRLIWAAPAFESITGRKRKDCIGYGVLVLLSPAHARAARRAFARARRRRGEPIEHTADVAKPDGRTVALDLRLRMIENPGGERYLIGMARPHVDAPAAPQVATPVTRSRESHVIALEGDLAEARQVAQVKSEFLATMSHEMRTPMSGVVSMTNMLLQGELNPNQRPIVELIRESMQTLLTLLTDTLDYSRL
jgi:PAS domain S-box-containing protein